MVQNIFTSKRILGIDCLSHVGEKVSIVGWIQTIRRHGKIAFFDIKDRSGILQVAVLDESALDTLSKLHPQDVVKVIGLVKKREERYVNPLVSTGSLELEATEISIISEAAELPFDMGGKELKLELQTLLDHRTLALRHPKISAIFKVQETIVKSFRQTLSGQGFTEIFVPTIVPTATEGGAEVFSIDYYGSKAYLGQSPQFYKQMMVSIFERVFTIAHAYRAEPSVTTRHLSEYVSLDAEMGFIESYTDVMDTAELIIKDIFTAVKENNRQELKLLDVGVLDIYDKTFPRIKMREAQEIIFQRTNRDHRSEPDLDPSDEKEICLWAQEEYGIPFVFITHFPTKKRPFYTMPDPHDSEYTLSFDLLGVNEEWVTGGQRIHDYNMLIEKIKQRGNNPKYFSMYLQAFQYGMPPEGGFAMGLERITKDILGLLNVRESSLFPRDMDRVDERLSQLTNISKHP